MPPITDKLNLRILRHLVAGEGVKVNISEVARRLDIHRATAKRRVKYLYENDILNPPQYVFNRLFDEYPLLVIVKADMPRTPEITQFYKDDSHIFAAFSCMEGPYNTLLIEFFKDLEDYHSWRENIVREGKVPSRKGRAAAEASIFSNRLTFKNEPNCFVRKMENKVSKNGHLKLDNVILSEEKFKLMKMLLEGDAIRTNESHLARVLGINRKTVGRRIKNMLKDRIISSPRCTFPNLFIPPGYNMILSLIEVTSNKQKVKRALIADENVSRAIETSTARYNFLLFTAFSTIEDFFKWGEKMNKRFPNSLGAISNTLLSSRTIHTIKPQKVSLGVIERELLETSRDYDV